MTNDELLAHYCGKYNVYKDELLSRRCDKRLVEIRRKIATELKENGWSFPQIGKLLNRHHSAIINLLDNKKRTPPETWEKLFKFMEENAFYIDDFLACVCANLLREKRSLFKTKIMVGGCDFTIRIDKKC